MAGRNTSSLSGTLDSPTMATGLALVTITVLVALRVVVGALVDEPVMPVTYLGLVGGLVGATAMIFAYDLLEFSGPTPAAQFWARYVDEVHPTSAVRPGMYVHLVYGAIAGSVYPKALWWAIGGSMVTVPGGLIGGLLYGSILAILAVAYRVAGIYQMDLSARMLTRYLVYHLVYGGWLGIVVGSYSLVYM